MRILIFLFLCILSSPIFGQLKGAVPQASAPAHINDERKVEKLSAASKAKDVASKMKKTLKLNDKQHDSLYKIVFEYETNVEKTTKSKLSKKQQFDKLNDLYLVQLDKMKALFTKEQFHAYKMSLAGGG